jgi:hypothetical protein
MYLLFIILAALCSSICKSIDGGRDTTIFKSWPKFWQPVEEIGFNALSVFPVLKLLLIAVCIVSTQFTWWQISFEKVIWIWQCLIIVGVYVFVQWICIDFIFEPKKQINHENELD